MCPLTVVTRNPIAICRLLPETGPCVDATYKRWYYDPDRRTCVPFIYTGCGGNFNRFKNFDTCVKFCTVPIRDVRLPPLIEVPEVVVRDRECMCMACILSNG